MIVFGLGLCSVMGCPDLRCVCKSCLVRNNRVLVSVIAPMQDPHELLKQVMPLF